MVQERFSLYTEANACHPYTLVSARISEFGSTPRLTENYKLAASSAVERAGRPGSSRRQTWVTGDGKFKGRDVRLIRSVVECGVRRKKAEERTALGEERVTKKFSPTAPPTMGGRTVRMYMTTSKVHGRALQQS